MKNWIAFDPEYGTEFFETEEQAQDYVQKLIADCRREARDEGWPD